MKPSLSKKDSEHADSDAQMAFSANQGLLACTADDGAVYVLDVSTNELSKMKVGHSSVCPTSYFRRLADAQVSV